jgi:hypothetical protein
VCEYKVHSVQISSLRLKDVFDTKMKHFVKGCSYHTLNRADPNFFNACKSDPIWKTDLFTYTTFLRVWWFAKSSNFYKDAEYTSEDVNWYDFSFTTHSFISRQIHCEVFQESLKFESSIRPDTGQLALVSGSGRVGGQRREERNSKFSNCPSLRHLINWWCMHESF